MLRRARRNAPATASAFTTTKRVLVITLAFLLAVSAVAVSRSSAVREKLRLSGDKPAPEQHSLSANAGKEMVRLRHSHRVPGLLSFITPVAPTVSATKADALFTDVDNDNQADPGDTIKYTVNIGASGEDATGVTFTDTVDPNTAFVGGSLTATPVAVNDTYAATGNIRISVAAPGVLGNDFAGLPSATLSAPVTSTNGGNVTVNPDGSFTYNPPAGFEGADTFTYTLTNSEGSNPGTVTINVSGMIWFIDNNASCPCDGRLTNPFNTLASFDAVNDGAGNNPAANDNIFVYESATDYVGPVTLLNGQRFFGQDATASLSAMTGLTPPAGSDPLPATNSGNGIIVNITSATSGINVASGNTLRGFTGGNAEPDINGSSFGTLTISDVTLNGTGQALNLTTGTLAATFVSIASTNSATTGISLTGVAGSLTSPTTTITNPTGIGISVGTSSATLNFGNTTSTLSGDTGVSLLTNTGTITFGSLNISPDAGQRGLLATDNSNTITSTGGAISTSGATAVEISRASGTTPLAISLTSVSANTAPPNGIFLQNTSGSFTIDGDGTNTTVGGNSSGGTITGATGADGATSGIAVYLNNVTNVTLRRLTINGSNQNFAVFGTTVTNFDLEYSKVTGTNGTNAALTESSVYFTGLTGSSDVTSSIIEGGLTNNFSVINTLGSLDRIIFTNDTFGPMDQGNVSGIDSLFLQAQSNATIKATVLNSSLTDARGDIFQFDLRDNAVGDLVFRGNVVNNTHPNIVTGGGGLTFSGGGSTAANTTFTYDVGGPNVADGNTFRGARGDALFIVLQTGHGSATGKIRNNTFGVTGINLSGSREATDIDIRTVGRGAQTVLIDNNDIRQYGNAGILLQSGDISVAGTSGTVGDINATITNNTIAEFNTNLATQPGISVNHGTTAGDTTFLCVDIQNNTANNAGDESGSGGRDYVIRQRQLTTVRLPAYAGASGVPVAGTVVADVTAYIQGRNVNGALSSVFVGVPTGGGGYVGGAACTQPAIVKSNFSDVNPNRMLRDRLAHHVKSARRAPLDEGQPADILRVAQGEPQGEKSSEILSSGAVAVMAQGALERWRAAGISVEDLARLQGVNFEVADLPAGQLASVIGTSITIDETAAGYGWYSDASPTEDSEFDVLVPSRELHAREDSPAFGRVDLLTVLMRELGTVYLQGHKPTAQLKSLMAKTISPSVRRLPDSRSITLPTPRAKAREKQTTTKNSVVAKVSQPSVRPAKQNARTTSAGVKSNHAVRTRTAAAPMSLADVMLNIGTLPAGESVTITFQVTVDNPFTGPLPQVSNQGTVSGTNFADVLTDDPSVGGAADPTVTPIDLPQVSVAVSPASVAEDGATNLTYTFTRTGSTANPMTVNFSVGGSASFTEPDYTQTGAATFTATSGTVVIPASSATAQVIIDPSADTTVEPDETVDLTVTSGTGYTVGSPSSASGTITNDDTDVSVAVSPASVTEDGATNLTYTFTRAGVTTNSLTVNFSIAVGGSNATFPADYAESGSTTFAPPVGTVTFSPGSSTAQVTIDPVADALVEPDETVILTVTAGTGYNVGSPSSATGTITNDDAEVTVAVSPSSVTEDGATNLVYTFTRTGFTAGPLLVSFSVGGTAVFSEPDYSQSGATSYNDTSGTVMFGAGNTTAQVTIDPTADANPEPDETVILTLVAGLGYTVGSPSSATGTILNDDTLVSVAVSPLTTSEGGAILVYTFTRTGSTASSLPVNFSVGGTAAFPADYSQTGATTFTPPTATVTIGAGSSTATVNVTPLADCASGESPETVVFTVQPGAGYGVGSPSTATGTITDVPDTTAPVITLDPNRPTLLSPPNHNYHNFTVSDFVLSASDNCDPNVDASDVYVTMITSDEAEDGAGDGSTLNDMTIAADCKSFQLRAERVNLGDGRVYTIHFKVVDAQGNVGTATAKVMVRVNANTPAVDGAPVYTVTSICP